MAVPQKTEPTLAGVGLEAKFSENFRDDSSTISVYSAPFFGIDKECHPKIEVDRISSDVNPITGGKSRSKKESRNDWWTNFSFLEQRWTNFSKLLHHPSCLFPKA